MQRFFTPAYLIIVLFAVLQMFVSCTNKVTCHELSGRWTTQEGQDFVFQQHGKALWLTRFGSQFDTVPFEYRLDCNTDPAAFDLYELNKGPYAGKKLFGILEWTSDTSFRLQYEPGRDVDSRPKVFSNETSLKFFPVK